MTIQSPGRSTTRQRGTTDHQASTEVPAQTMATPGMNLESLASLHADELQNLIEILQGLAVSRQEGKTPMQQPHVHASAPAEEEAIRWEKVGTGKVPVTEAPYNRPPPTHDHINAQTLAVEKTPSDPRPPSQVSTFAHVCSKKQRTDSLAAFPAIFNLQDNNVTATSERVKILASLPEHERPSLLIIVEEPKHHIRVLWGIEKLPFSYANRTALDGRIVAFFCDTLEGNTPPIIAIDKEWCDQEDCPIPTEQQADSDVSKLQLRDTRIPEASTIAKTTRLTRACITPLALAHQLLTAPYLSQRPPTPPYLPEYMHGNGTPH